MQRKMAAEALTSDAVADAILFGEELDGDKLLFTDAKALLSLGKTLRTLESAI